MFRGGQATVSTVEVALNAIGAGDVAVAANFPGATGQAGLAFARSAADGIRRHLFSELHPGSGPERNRGIGRSALQETVDNGVKSTGTTRKSTKRAA